MESGAGHGGAPRWERKAEARPTDLYRAALKLFSERGYRATRLEEVAEEAGVSKGTIYHYFKNKEDLLLQALENKAAELLSQVESALAGHGGDAEDKLVFLLERAWNRWREDDWGRFSRLMTGEMASEFPELYRGWIRNNLAALRVPERLIREGQEAGLFRADLDPRAAIRFAHLGLSKLALTYFHMGADKADRLSADTVFRTALGIFVRGIRASGARARGAGETKQPPGERRAG